MIGVIKKVLIADNIAPFCNEVFADPSRYNSPICLMAVYGFAVQIYCDFSGYCDFAIGTGRLFGIRLPENFNKPYWSVSITEFWRRWHMSLSFWLRDYLYIPLGGSRCSKLKTYRNLLLTMVLGGLWHGASWTFAVWGLLHGMLLSFERAMGWGAGSEQIANRWVRFGRMVITFHLVCIGWVFFRASDLATAIGMLKRIVLFDLNIQLSGAALLDLLSCGSVILTLLIILLGTRRAVFRLCDRVPNLAVPVVYALLVIVTVFLAPSGTKEFIYFQF
jgi:D-alanyl-lipoteichoic acid acyltransferase DltB (MBOAT superfamily)